jgi:hypothetical protein
MLKKRSLMLLALFLVAACFTPAHARREAAWCTWGTPTSMEPSIMTASRWAATTALIAQSSCGSAEARSISTASSSAMATERWKRCRCATAFLTPAGLASSTCPATGVSFRASISGIQQGQVDQAAHRGSLRNSLKGKPRLGEKPGAPFFASLRKGPFFLIHSTAGNSQLTTPARSRSEP